MISPNRRRAHRHHDTTPADFNLDAGDYGLLFSAASGAQLQKLLPDGSTYAAVSGTATSAAGYSVLQLPAGQYRLVVTGSTTGEIAKINRGRS